MKRWQLVAATLILAMGWVGSADAQDRGNWKAASSTANAITGDVGLANEKLAINFNLFPVAEIRALTAPEMSALFGEENGTGGVGRLYKVSIPATKRFLHKNTLCGSDETEWMATFVRGKSLQLAFFSGVKPPLLTAEAMANTSDLCGTYSYVRQ